MPDEINTPEDIKELKGIKQIKARQASCMKCGLSPITMNQSILEFPNGAVISILNCVQCGCILPHAVIAMRQTTKSQIIS